MAADEDRGESVLHITTKPADGIGGKLCSVEMMTELQLPSDSEQQPKCRHCGHPAPRWVSTCLRCGQRVVPFDSKNFDRGLRRWERTHTGDIIASVVLFAFTNFALLSASYDDFFSLTALYARLYFLGVPTAVVVYNWYLLMHEVDPDYGHLWRTYWYVQIFVWSVTIGLLILLIVALVGAMLLMGLFA